MNFNTDKEKRYQSCFFSVFSIFHFPHEIENIIYSYLKGLIWLQYKNLQLQQNEIFNITYDCIKQRTCFILKNDPEINKNQVFPPFWSIYYSFSNCNLSKTIQKHINKMNTDSFYDETCLSRICGYEKPGKVFASLHLSRLPFWVRITNQTSLEFPTHFFFKIVEINSKIKILCTFYPLPLAFWSYGTRKKEIYFDPLNEEEHNNNDEKTNFVNTCFLVPDQEFIFALWPKQILFYSLRQQYCQILVELKNIVVNDPFSWTLYRKKYLIVIEYLNCVDSQVVIYKIKKKLNSMNETESLLECIIIDQLTLPSCLNKEMWKVFNDDFHHLFYIVNESSILQFEFKTRIKCKD